MLLHLDTSIIKRKKNRIESEAKSDNPQEKVFIIDFDKAPANCLTKYEINSLKIILKKNIFIYSIENIFFFFNILKKKFIIFF